MKKWPPKKVQVNWQDSIFCRSWDDIEEKQKQLKADNLEHVSVGYLVQETDDYVAITHSVGLGIHNVSDTLQIPRTAITKIRRIK